MGPDLNSPLNLLIFALLMILIGVVAAEIEHRRLRKPRPTPAESGLESSAGSD
jgi:hypothetical protein